MKLIKFRVTKFRSVKDTDWIDVDNTTAFVGENEAGKTNLLIPLWKLNPANNEEIKPLIDYPRKEYSQFDKTGGTENFIEAIFAVDKNTLEEYINSQLNGIDLSESEKIKSDVAKIEYVYVGRDYNGNYAVKLLSKDQKQEENEVEVNIEGMVSFILKNIPKFVYYAEYGNLDSNIYLPDVINKFKREKEGEEFNQKENAKNRTLKVLFEYVGLEPEHIKELGNEDTDQQVSSEKKQERQILLDSASTKLSEDFRKWWKQGDYNFSFKADGNYFRIWVSDAVRRENIELESRSRGLQWFFSFFLVFLVESKDAHQGCILLLDEPGVTLHPNAQEDLIDFFNSLADKNQLIYTTHSPFLVDPENLNKVKAVRVDEEGYTEVSNDLGRDPKYNSALYPVNSAIGLSLSKTMFLGCKITLVEGQSDQIYLNMIKNYLISKGKIKPKQEMVFIQTGGTKGIISVMNILLGRDHELLNIILDSDDAGNDKAKSLKDQVYKQEKEHSKLIQIGEFSGVKNAEIEDIIPQDLITKAFSKLYRGNDKDFDEVQLDTKESIVIQMEKFASDNSITLEKGYKTAIAEKVYTLFDKATNLSDAQVLMWENLFKKII